MAEEVKSVEAGSHAKFDMDSKDARFFSIVYRWDSRSVAAGTLNQAAFDLAQLPELSNSTFIEGKRYSNQWSGADQEYNPNTSFFSDAENQKVTAISGCCGPMSDEEPTPSYTIIWYLNGQYHSIGTLDRAFGQFLYGRIDRDFPEKPIKALYEDDKQLAIERGTDEFNANAHQHLLTIALSSDYRRVWTASCVCCLDPAFKLMLESLAKDQSEEGKKRYEEAKEAGSSGKEKWKARIAENAKLFAEDSKARDALGLEKALDEFDSEFAEALKDWKDDGAEHLVHHPVHENPHHGALPVHPEAGVAHIHAFASEKKEAREASPGEKCASAILGLCGKVLTLFLQLFGLSRTTGRLFGEAIIKSINSSCLAVLKPIAKALFAASELKDRVALVLKFLITLKNQLTFVTFIDALRGVMSWWEFLWAGGVAIASMIACFVSDGASLFIQLLLFASNIIQLGLAAKAVHDCC